MKTKLSKKGLKLIVLWVLLGLITIGLCVYGAISLYTCYINEFNAQIQQLGFYKSDITILWQYPKEIISIICIVIGSVGLLFIIGWIILTDKSDFYDYKSYTGLY